MRTLWYTAFWVASLTFLALVYVEWQIPGFVSSSFSLAIFLPLMLVSGIGALAEPLSARPVRRMHEVLAVCIGLLFAIVVFREGDAFGALRLFLAIAMLFLPLVLIKVLADDRQR